MTFHVSFSYFSVPHIFIPTIMLENGNSLKEGSISIGVLSVANAIGRLLCSLVNLCPKRVMAVNVGAGISAASSIVVMANFSNDVRTIYIACAVYGLSIAPFSVLTTLSMMHVIQSEDIVPAYGLTISIFGLYSLIGPPLIGWLSIYYGNFAVPLIYAAASFVAASICYALAEYLVH